MSERPSRPNGVIGATGKPLTFESLPPSDTTRWVIRRKAEVVAAVRRSADSLTFLLNSGATWEVSFNCSGLNITRGRVRRPERAEIRNLAMIRPLGVAALAILTLSACAPVDTMIEGLFPPEAATAVGSAEAPPVPRRKPEAISEVTLAGADPQRLVGLDFDDTKALLGDPATRMEQPPAKVWAYAGGGCMISVFFYPSVDNQVFRVLAIEVTDEAVAAGTTEDRESEVASPKVIDQDDPAVRRCFADLLQNQQAPNAG